VVTGNRERGGGVAALGVLTGPGLSQQTAVTLRSSKVLVRELMRSRHKSRH
jgi:hypothetical protein